MTDEPQVPTKIRRGGFKPGQSGNPAGKPKGSSNRTTMLAQVVLDGGVEKIMETLVRKAIDGDPTALKLAVERLIPLRRGRPLQIELPAIVAASDAITAMGAIVKAVANGVISPEEAAELSSLVDAGRRVIETADHEVRLIELEANRGN